jgi:hypothetical protein
VSYYLDMLDHVAETSDAVSALERLVVDNAELEQLESLLNPFNIFEAVGAVAQEVRHSDFLAFMLSPSQNHGLGDLLAKRFLQKAVQAAAGQTEISLIDLDVWDLGSLEVRREWHAIDILLLDERNGFAVIIENKVHSGEHDDQLNRYWQVVSSQFPKLKVLGILLTLKGERPSDDRFIPIDYATICQLVESLAATMKSAPQPELRTLLGHYVQMVRRHLLEDSEIAELARRIYKKHRRALDLIYEYRPDRQAYIKEVLDSLISSDLELCSDPSTKSYINFSLREWDNVPLMRTGTATSTGRILLFSFQNDPSRLALNLTIGPGPLENRKLLFDIAVSNKPLFKPSQSMLGKNWNTVFQRIFLSGALLEEQEMDLVEDKIREQWEHFRVNQLPAIAKSFGDTRLTQDATQ